MLTLSSPNPRGFPIRERMQRRWFALEDRWFEWRHGLELSAIVPHSQPLGSPQAAVPHARVFTGASWCRSVRTLLVQARRANPALRYFVDLGSGKGKACFFAATQMPFERVIGVEFSEPLVAMAQRNAQRFGAPNVRFELADAGDFALPDGATLVFMFNPFDGAILDRFLTLNRTHFERHRTLVGYSNDRHRDVLRLHGFDTTFRDPARQISLFHRT
jgi:SAM-dependent methyltransferase